MGTPHYPAAYLSVGSLAGQLAMVEAAAQRGWPEPDLYAGPPGSGSPALALAELTAAIAAGRHDALLLAIPPADQPSLMELLATCTSHGVTVSFLRPGQADEPAGLTPGAQPAGLTPGAQPAGPGQQWGTLTRARLDALAGLFPGWRIWVDAHGWHARRRDGHLQMFRPGAPAFHVQADTATDLAAQLCWQQAADTHVPQGCARGRLAAESGLTARSAAVYGA
jgi:hypothetical protein